MRKIGIIVCLIGALGVLFGAFGAHSVRSQIDPARYASYRVGIEYLFFHLVPLLFIANSEYKPFLLRTAYLFIVGIICFTGSNLLMTTEEIHHVNFHFLWPVTPLGGILFLMGWLVMAYNFYKKSD